MTFILVVEDDPDLRELYKAALSRRGHRVEMATCVQDGLEQMVKARPDFVVTDLGLPDGSGLSVVRAAARQSPPIPTVIASGSDSERDIVAGNASGARDFLVKPFPMSLLLSKIDLHLQRRGGGAIESLIPGGRENAFYRYRIKDVIGKGGGGVVYRATDKESGSEVALKVRTTRMTRKGDSAERLRRRFQREAYSLSSVDHENLAKIRGHGSERGFDYIAMDLVKGETLAQYVERLGPLDEHALTVLMDRLGRALSAIHARGLVHRDLKPSNIILRESCPAVPVLVDFGLAKLVYDRSLTLADERYGTPAYMAPEQVLGQPATIQSDLFSLGLVACFAASGHRAFPNLDLPGLLTALCSRPMQIPSVSPPLRVVLRHLTKISLERRTGSANQLLRELAGVAAINRGATA